MVLPTTTLLLVGGLATQSTFSVQCGIPSPTSLCSRLCCYLCLCLRSLVHATDHGRVVIVIVTMMVLMLPMVIISLVSGVIGYTVVRCL